MNYVLVVTGTNFNDFVSIEKSIGAGHASKETGSSKDYILLPLWKNGSLFDSSSKMLTMLNHNLLVMPEKRMMMVPSVTTAPLEATHADLFGNETKVDMSNISTTYQVPSTPNTRIHKDHSLDHEEPKKVIQELKDPSWIEAMEEELLQFTLQQIDKSLIVKRFKDDILLVQVYVDDIIFRSTRKESCTKFEKMTHKKFQMRSMGELTFFLGLSLIGSLMYLTSSRPDIMFDVCACARFQVTPKVSQLHAVKRIFRYCCVFSKL
nr:hypothetical protein [Tanacetum cinerariifolium]